MTRLTSRIVLVAMVVAVIAVSASPAVAQVDQTGTSFLIVQRTLQVPDPCQVGQTITFRTKIAIREATDIGLSLQSVRVRVRIESEVEPTAGTDLDLRGEGEANYLTLVSNSALGQQYALPLTAVLTTDTTSEQAPTPYGDVLYNVGVNLDPAAKETVTFKVTSSSCSP